MKIIIDTIQETNTAKSDDFTVSAAKKKVSRGDNLHNRKKNKTGVVLDGKDIKKIKVKTVSGDDVWDLKDCDIVEEFD